MGRTGFIFVCLIIDLTVAGLSRDSTSTEWNWQTTVVANGRPSAANYKIVERGRLYDLDYTIYLKDVAGRFISAWHDIPLYADDSNETYHMVVEIPRWTNAKMEMTTSEPMAPIRQSVTRDGAPRFVANIFPYHGYPFNYGALPQTWEDVGYRDPHTNTTGDGDPIDVLEIGAARPRRRGEIVTVKVLGVLGMLDAGQTDWKLVAIDVEDLLANELNDIDDVHRRLPGLLESLREWLRVYKTPNGGAPSTFAFNGAFKNAAFARQTVMATYNAWRALIRNPHPPFNAESHMDGTAFPADDNAWSRLVDESPTAKQAEQPPAAAERWHYSESLMAADRRRTTAVGDAAAERRAVEARAEERGAVAALLCAGGAVAMALAIAVFVIKWRQRRNRY